jgi:subfamily B ATP-binding cassette protein MsbA
MAQIARRGVLRRLYKIVKLYKVRIFFGVVCTVLMGLTDAFVAGMLALLIDGLTKAGENIVKGTEILAETRELTLKRFGIDYTVIHSFSIQSISQAKTLLLLLGLAIIVLMIIKGICVYSKEYLMASVIQKTVKRIRDGLYANLLYLQMAFFDRSKTGEVMSKMTNDVQIIEQSLNAFVVIVQAFVYTVIFVSLLFIINWKLTLLSLIIFPVFAGILKLFSDGIRRASRRILSKLADINAVLQETITGIKVIKTYTGERREIENFSQKTYQNYAHSMRASRLVAFLKPTNEFISTVGMAAIILYCGFSILNRSMDIALFTGFAALITMAYKPIKTLGEAQPNVDRAVAAGERIFELMDEQTELEIHHIETFETPVRGAIEFRAVVFSYNSTDTVLNGISFAVKPGETTALVGPSGAGKSTIMQLLLRFYECQSGAIFIDGKDISKVSRALLRSQIGLVPQETILFSGQMIDNIRYGKPDAAVDEIVTAAKSANAHDFIMTLPNGYNTEIGERGLQLSGGQRQRVAIARALLKNSPVLLLDEATSSLDSESERLVQEATEILMRQRTTLVIAHRLSTVRNAHTIIVLDKGIIVQMGTHQQLLEQGGLYKSLHDLQFR